MERKGGMIGGWQAGRGEEYTPVMRWPTFLPPFNLLRDGVVGGGAKSRRITLSVCLHTLMNNS